MSTEDVTLDHIKKMLDDAKVVAGCRKTCKHTVSESENEGTRFFTITHESEKTIDSYQIPAASMDLMEEMAVANFLLARHETTRLAREYLRRDVAADNFTPVKSQPRTMRADGGIPSSLDILAEERKVWNEEFRQVSEDGLVDVDVTP